MRLNNPNNRTSLLAILLVPLLLAPQQALALASDREKPINIKSESGESDFENETSIYRGNAVMVQGTTRITGDVITIYMKQRVVTKVIAEAKTTRAYYEEQQDKGKGTLQAWGHTIRYDIQNNTVNLITNAELAQNGDTFKGDTIHYNVTQQTVKAEGSPKEDGNKRIEMVILPRPAKK